MDNATGLQKCRYFSLKKNTNQDMIFRHRTKTNAWLDFEILTESSNPFLLLFIPQQFMVAQLFVTHLVFQIWTNC